MTRKELIHALIEDSRLNDSDEIRVVFHGYSQHSFNLAAAQAYRGANGNDFLIIVNEPRKNIGLNPSIGEI